METKTLKLGPDELIYKISFYNKKKIYITIVKNEMYCNTLIDDEWFRRGFTITTPLTQETKDEVFDILLEIAQNQIDN